MKKAPTVIAAAVTGALLALAACGSRTTETSRDASPVPTSTPSEGLAARAQATTPYGAGSPSPVGGASVETVDVIALGGSGVHGQATLTETADGVRIEAAIEGLTAGEHGIHVHENGDCSGDGSAAGGHFNPDGTTHGPLDPSKPHHAGDLGNLTADTTGHALLNVTTRQFTLADGPRSIRGRSLVVHETADDLTSQPAGNSGKRVACGLIGKAGSTAPAAGAMGTP